MQLGDSACDLLVTNDSSAKVYLAFGNTPSVVADESGIWIMADSQQVLNVPMGYTWVAVRAATDTAVGGAGVGVATGVGAGSRSSSAGSPHASMKKMSATREAFKVGRGDFCGTVSMS